MHNKIVNRVVTDYIKTKLSKHAIHLANTLHADLWHGPLYFDSDGDECSPFDEGAKQFDFSRALTILSQHVDSRINDFWSEPEGYEDEDGEWCEPCWEDVYYVSRQDALQHAFGKELASYL